MRRPFARARAGFPELSRSRTQATRDGMPTFWAPTRSRARRRWLALKRESLGLPDAVRPHRDRRAGRADHREGQPASDFTVVYHLLSFERNDGRAGQGGARRARTPSLPTVTDLWPAANWYEREAWDMFGIVFDGHPHLTRHPMPPTWKGHPLRKDHPARATEMGPFHLPDEQRGSGAGGAAVPARKSGA